MPDIFISYAHEDAERIEALGLTLEAQGWSVFWDRSIPTGQTWHSHIGKALRDARCVIVAWSNHSIGSSWVYEEAEDGKQRGILIPILLDSIQPPIGFRSIQAADLSDWQPSGSSPRFEQLLHDLKSVLGATSSQPPTKRPAKRLAKPEVDTPRPVRGSAQGGQKTFPRQPGYAPMAVTLSLLAGGGYWGYQTWLSDSQVTGRDPTQSTTKIETPSTGDRDRLAAAQRLTPVFEVTPGATTRRDVEELLKEGKLRPLGPVQEQGGDRIDFSFGAIVFQAKDSDHTRNPFDTVISIEYWGDEPLPLGFRTQMELEQAKHLAEEHFEWLGTQDFRGLVFSNKKNGPILLEIGLSFRGKNSLTYKIFGPI